MTKGIIFDYGGTLDTGGLHWSEVLWLGYQDAQVPVSKEQFRECYVYAERELARHPYIKPQHNFLDLLRIKLRLETGRLVAHGYWQAEEESRRAAAEQIAQFCYAYVLRNLLRSRPVAQELAKRYPLALVSNFYGNIGSVLRDFRLELFQRVIESALVGVRKPDPRIFRLGVEALGCKPRETVVVGDSFGKDIVPASQIGCQTVWMKGKGWADEPVDPSLPTWTITDIGQLAEILL
ncbi:MAG: HAD family hydrolase [Prevotellaceae bacterium]|nr:HAD family hydrolase [Prevotellaceae bacterium]